MADTMVVPHLKNPVNDMNSRKNKKPLMEKRRRARINSCLTQLKSLVLQAIKKDSSQFSKLEKADILELTVKHLRALQRQQVAGVMTSDPNVASKYRAGFNECAKEIVRYISSVREVHDDVKERLLGHLAGCLQVVNHVTVAETLQQQQQHQQQMSMKPLHVHIPQQQQQQQQQGLTAVPASVILHSQVPQASALPPHHHHHHHHQAAAALTAFAAPSPSSSVSLRSSPPAREPSPIYSATPLSSLPQQGATHSPAPHLAGAFKVVYLGHRDSPVSLDALPIYSVALPPHSEAAFSHPVASSASHLTSQGMTSHLLLDTSYGSVSSPSSSSSTSSSSSPRLTPPVRLEYSPLHSSALPVDLRQSHKVRAACLEQPRHHQPLNYAQCPTSALSDEKLWRPW